MPRNGSGIYSLPAGQPVVTGTVIDSTVHNSFASDVATALTNSLAKNGETVPTANLPMGGNKITGLGDATVATDAMNRQASDARYAQLSGGTFTGSVTISNSDPLLNLTDTAQAADNRRWALNANGAFTLYAVDDTGSTFTPAINVTRSGTTITGVALTATAVTFNGVNITDYARLSQSNVFTSGVQIRNSSPSLDIVESDASTDNANWAWLVAGEDMSLRLYAGAPGSFGSSTSVITVTRTGTTCDSLALAATAITLNGVNITDYARLSQSNTFTGDAVFSSSNPALWLQETDAAANNRLWRIRATSEQLIGDIVNDANSVNTSWLVVDRTGTTIDSVALSGTALTWNGNTLFTTANDGASSGLDADLLDGQEGSFYRSASNLNAGTIPDARIQASGVTQHQTSITAVGAAATINSQTIGYRNIPQNAQNGNYTLVLGDAGFHIYHASGAGSGDTYTIPANASVAFPVGTAVTFVNSDSNSVSIAITTDTMTLAGTTTTGTRTLGQNGVATAIKVTSTSWIISGSGLS